MTGKSKSTKHKSLEFPFYPFLICSEDQQNVKIVFQRSKIKNFYKMFIQQPIQLLNQDFFSLLGLNIFQGFFFRPPPVPNPVGHGSLTAWVTYFSHFCGSLPWVIFVGHFCGSLPGSFLWVIFVGHLHGSLYLSQD